MLQLEVKDNATLKEALEALCAFLTARDIPSERIFDSKLVACELLGNVLRHADGNARLKGEIKDGFIELKVFSDVIFHLPETRLCADVFSEHGRGLFLVDSVCEKRVFAEQDGIRVLIEICR
ncbi:MAG: hypothetical protein IJX87_06370 [Clostridia bacterium]|nr:hypothetical protein [Clostridia bacterium]